MVCRKIHHKIVAQDLRFNFGQGAEARVEVVLIGQFENFVPQKTRNGEILHELYLEKYLYDLLRFSMMYVYNLSFLIYLFLSMC